MAVFLRKWVSLQPDSASRAKNETTHGWCFQEPLVSLPKAHLVLGLQGLRLMMGLVPLLPS